MIMFLSPGVINKPSAAEPCINDPEERTQPVHDGQVRSAERSGVAASQPLVRQPRRAPRHGV